MRGGRNRFLNNKGSKENPKFKIIVAWTSKNYLKIRRGIVGSWSVISCRMIVHGPSRVPDVIRLIIAVCSGIRRLGTTKCAWGRCWCGLLIPRTSRFGHRDSPWVGTSHVLMPILQVLSQQIRNFTLYSTNWFNLTLFYFYVRYLYLVTVLHEKYLRNMHVHMYSLNLFEHWILMRSVGPPY